MNPRRYGLYKPPDQLIAEIFREAARQRKKNPVRSRRVRCINCGTSRGTMRKEPGGYLCQSCYGRRGDG